MSCREAEQSTYCCFHPQLLALPAGVVGVEELGDVLGAVLVRAGLGVLLLVEQVEVDLMEALALPQAQGANVLGARSR